MNKKKFYIYQEDLIRYEVGTGTLTISQFVAILNKEYGVQGMQKLRTDTITNYLCDKGYLVIDDKNRKRPTSKGNLLGIEIGKTVDKLGNEYEVNLYNDRVREYILDNLYEMI